MHSSKFLITILLVLPSFVASARLPAAEKITYDDHILPLFKSKCFGCHNQDKRKGGLALNTYPLMREGGSSGEVIEPGDADLDGFRNLVDLNIWLAGGVGTWSNGDLDGDGNINLVDLNIWLASPSSAPFATSTIPEPATLWLVALGALVLLPRSTR